MSSQIDYGNLMHQAMRDLIRKVLTRVSKEGLPGDHHFFITFDTRCSGVEMADWLMERYPEDMTIVVQNWFDNLLVEDDHFAITLNFGNSPEPLVVPYDALRTFVDPSVEFGLRFESQSEEPLENVEDEDVSIEELMEDITELEKLTKDPSATKGEVVQLDRFRK